MGLASWVALVSKKKNKAEAELKEVVEVKLSRLPSPFDQLERASRAEEARAVLHKIVAITRSPQGLAEQELRRRAVEVFQRCLKEAYPPGFDAKFALLKAGRSEGLEMALAFLEADPWFFGSGYVKADLLRFICRMSVAPVYWPRLKRIVLAAILLRDRRELRFYRRLAGKVFDSEFSQQVEALTVHEDAGVRRRARWILEHCRQVSADERFGGNVKRR